MVKDEETKISKVLEGTGGHGDGNGRTLHIQTQWDIGIGGGSLLCAFIKKHEVFFSQTLKGKRILELGSGTGLLGLFIAALSPTIQPKEIVITDCADHLDLIGKNAVANHLPPSASLRIVEYDWRSNDLTTLGPLPFDIILGTDVAYCEQLYAPVIKALSNVAGPESLILLGVTRTDTGPSFFKLLNEAGFDYCLVRCHDVHDGGDKGGGQGGGNDELRGFALFSVIRRGH